MISIRNVFLKEKLYLILLNNNYKTMKRLLFRLLYYPFVSFLKIINVLRPRTYMKWFVCLLKKSGMKINGMPRYISSDVYFDNFAAITLSERTVISKQCVFLTHDYSPTTAFFTPPH